MKQKLAILRNEDGFIAAELLITIISSGIFWGLVVAVFIIIGTYSIFNKEIDAALKNSSNPSKTEEKTIIFKNNPNVFTPRPVEQSQPAQPPKEPIRSENNRVGGPTSVTTIAGEWHGRYTATSPPMFKGKGGGWEAMLYEDRNGNISGNYSSDFGISGKVVGTRTGDDAMWKIGSGDSGLKYKGTIKGHTISGIFWGEIFKGQYATGNFFGGRIVK